MDVVSLTTPLMMLPMVNPARKRTERPREHACRATHQRQPTWTKPPQCECGLLAAKHATAHTRRHLPAAGTQRAVLYTYK